MREYVIFENSDIEAQGSLWRERETVKASSHTAAGDAYLKGEPKRSRSIKVIPATHVHGAEVVVAEVQTVVWDDNKKEEKDERPDLDT